MEGSKEGKPLSYIETLMADNNHNLLSFWRS